MTLRSTLAGALRKWLRPVVCAAVGASVLLPCADLAHIEYVSAVPVHADRFGIDSTRYRPSSENIRRNETFAAILAKHGTERLRISDAMRKMEPLLDARRLRAGAPIRVYRDVRTDSARLFVYKPSPERYVVLDFRDSVAVYGDELPVTVTRRVVHASIESSPYQALAQQGADPNLALKLARVFAWQVDFHRIQNGDQFSIAFDEHRVDGAVTGASIVAARFEQKDRTHYAFWYNHDGSAGFYDEDGNTLKRAFLRAPLEYTRISSRYSLRRYHPVQRRYKPHLGTDYAAPTGTPIVSTADGTVMEATYNRGNGRYVKIRHNNTYMTAYLHMSRIAGGIRPGTRVEQGQLIGYVGSTGLATGPHVCYRFWMNGKQVDPLELDMPPAAPIDEDQRADYFVVRDSLLSQLRPGV